MAIKVQHQASFPLVGRVAQLAGEGAYRTQQLNPLATSDADRNVRTQLSLLDLVEGARRANLQAQVSRSNFLGQQQQAQAQAQFGRQSSERMALFGAAQSRQQQQAASMMNAQAAAANFRRQRSLGQARFGQQLEIGEQEFGFDQQLQEQRDLALDERQQAEMRRRELSGIMQTLEPQAQGQIRTINFQRQRFMEDQRKRPVLRPDEFQQQLQTFDQRIDEVIQNAQQQPSLEEQFQQGVHWRPDDTTAVNTPWVLDQKSNEWRVAQGWKPPEQPEAPEADYSVKEQYAAQNSYEKAMNDFVLKRLDAEEQRVSDDEAKAATLPSRSFREDLLRKKYMQDVTPPPFYTPPQEGIQQAAPPAQQAPQMQKNRAAQQQAAAQRQIQIQTQQLWEKYAKPKGISMLQWTHTSAVITNDRSKLIEGQVYTVHTETQEFPGVWVGDRFVVIQRGA